MTPRDPYLLSFLAEMRGYVADVRRHAGVLASPTRFGDLARTALFELRRIGHTIAGLAQTVRLADVVMLGAALNDTMAALIRTDQSPSGAVVAPLTRLAVYIETRLDSMAVGGSYQPAGASEQAEAERLTAAVRAFAPHRAGEVAPVPEAPPAPRLLGAPTMPLGVDDAPLPPDLQRDIEAFLRADLATDDADLLPPPRPAVRALPGPDAVTEYIQELSDDIARMQRAIVGVQQDEYPAPALEDLRLTAHKVRGTAFTVGIASVGAVGDIMEPMLNALKQGQIILSDTAQAWLIASVNALETLCARLATEGAESDATDLLASLHESYAVMLAESTDPGVSSLPPRLVAPEHEAAAPNLRHSVRVGLRQMEQLMATVTALSLSRADQRRLLVGGQRGEHELQRVIPRLAELHQRLLSERAADRARPGAEPAPRRGTAAQQSEFDLQMNIFIELINDLRSLDVMVETAFNRLARQSEYLGYLMDQAQRDVLALRLAPLSEVVPRLHLVASATAIAESKQVELLVEGATVELDREIAASIYDALAQLVRNAVVHGVEPPVDRVALGKPPVAQIWLRARHDGDEVTITIADDGQGIDHAAVIRAAVQVGALPPDAAPSLPSAAVLDLLFLPDVSTADAVRPTAGRGMGLPTVKRAVEAVRGAVTIESEPGAGTTFRLRLPVTLGLLHGFIVRAGDDGYALPITTIQRTSLVDPATITMTAGGARAVIPDLLGGEHELPIATLMDLLGHPGIATHGTTVVVVVVDGAEYAVVVDDILEEGDRMIVRAVPEFLRVRGVRGATISPQSELLLILDLPEIARQAVRRGVFGAHSPLIRTGQEGALAGDHILVVDDSPSIQFGVGQTLRDAGYDVVPARDGMDALDQLALALPRLILLDVEMPRLDGFEVLRQLRADPQTRDIPVIMLTSRAAPQFREHALHLGAVDYLVKPTGTDQLVKAVGTALAAGKDAAP